MTLNPDDGRLYVCAGDYNGAGSSGSYRQFVLSASLAERISGGTPNSGWRVDAPECGPLQPKHPDYISFEWDANRHLFWMIPGKMMTTDNASNCPGETNVGADDPAFINSALMTFDPVNKWAKSWPKFSPLHAHPIEFWRSVLDPVKDEIQRPYYRNTSTLDILNLGTGVWRDQPFIPQRPAGVDVNIWHRYIATDFKARQAYAFSTRLYRWHLDTFAFEDLGLPPQASTDDDWKCVWDSINNVLIYNAYAFGWWAYHPETKWWEQLPSMSDQFVKASGRIMEFDKVNNCVVVWGQNSTDPNITPSTPWMFLYRYKESTVVKPSAPQNLSATLI